MPTTSMVVTTQPRALPCREWGVRRRGDMRRRNGTCKRNSHYSSALRGRGGHDDSRRVSPHDLPHDGETKAAAFVGGHRLTVKELKNLVEAPFYRARVKRGIVIQVEAWDWNCPQHITPGWSREARTLEKKGGRTAVDPPSVVNQALLRWEVVPNRPSTTSGSCASHRMSTRP